MRSLTPDNCPLIHALSNLQRNQNLGIRTVVSESRCADVLIQIGHAAIMASTHSALALHVAKHLRLGTVDFDWVVAKDTHKS